MNRNFLVVAVSIFILNSAQVMAQNYKITSRTTDTGKEETYTDKSTGEVRKEITYNENGIKTKTLEITNGEQGRIYTKYDGNENLVSVTYYDKVGTVIQLDTWAKDGSKTSRTYVNPHDLKTYRMIKKIYSTDGVTLTSEDVYVPSASAISQYEHMSAGLNISEGDLVKADKATLELIEKTKALGPIIDNKTVISSAETNYPSVVLPWSMLPPINKPAPKSNVVEVPFGAHHYYTPQGDDSKEYDEIINKKVVTYSDKGTGAIVHIIVYSDDARTIKKEESIYNDKGKEVLSRVYGVDGSSIKNEYITEYSADGTTLIKTTYKEYRQDGSLFKQKTMNEQDKSEVNETYRKDGQTLSYRSVREQTDMGISVIDREETWYAKDGKTPAKTQSEKTEASNSYFKVIKYLYPNGQAKEVEVFTKPTGVLFTVNTTTYNEAGEVTSEKTETGDLNIVNKNFDMHTPNTELPLYE
ncbi:MAG: hypothetical protein WCQ53_08095, partial [bacterium]